jgi:hypothetical protein
MTARVWELLITAMRAERGEKLGMRAYKTLYLLNVLHCENIAVNDSQNMGAVDDSPESGKG